MDFLDPPLANPVCVCLCVCVCVCVCVFKIVRNSVKRSVQDRTITVRYIKHFL